MGAGLAQGIIAARDLVAPRFDETALAALVRQRLGETGDTARTTVGSDAETASYLSGFVPGVGQRLISVHAAMADIVGSSAATLELRAARVRAEVLAPLEQIRAAVAQRSVRDPALAAAHQLLAVIVGEEVAAAGDIAEGYERADPQLFQQGAALWVATQQEYGEWLSTMVAMGQRVTRS
jgi:hypothetical protein